MLIKQQNLRQKLLCLKILTNVGRKYLQRRAIFSRFAVMSFFHKIINKSKKSLKFSASDPLTFEEVWSFTSTRIRVLSLITLLVLVIMFLSAYFFGGLFSDAGGKDVSIERERLEEQHKEIAALKKLVDNRDRQLNAIKKILTGDVPIDSKVDSLVAATEFKPESIDDKPSASEKALSRKVKQDMRTTRDGKSAIPYFKSPVKGVVSQKFSKETHPGIDIVTEKDHTVKACLAGTVIYSGYSRNDGYICIIDHANGFVSIYKHNKKVLKKMGTKVQLGDPIAIVGNTGENSDGPHLHFELWYDQTAVNPSEYMKFKR